MKYLILIHGNRENAALWTDEDMAAHLRRHLALDAELTATGELIASEGLSDPDEARIVRLRNGVPEVTDGPFAETKEHLAGFYLVDCADARRAAEIAARLPEARSRAIEVRRVATTPEHRPEGAA